MNKLQTLVITGLFGLFSLSASAGGVWEASAGGVPIQFIQLQNDNLAIIMFSSTQPGGAGTGKPACNTQNAVVLDLTTTWGRAMYADFKAAQMVTTTSAVGTVASTRMTVVRGTGECPANYPNAEWAMVTDSYYGY